MALIQSMRAEHRVVEANRYLRDAACLMGKSGYWPSGRPSGRPSPGVGSDCIHLGLRSEPASGRGAESHVRTSGHLPAGNQP